MVVYDVEWNPQWMHWKAERFQDSDLSNVRLDGGNATRSTKMQDLAGMDVCFTSEKKLDHSVI